MGEKLISFIFQNDCLSIKFLESMKIKEGVFCDVYEFKMIIQKI